MPLSWLLPLLQNLLHSRVGVHQELGVNPQIDVPENRQEQGLVENHAQELDDPFIREDHGASNGEPQSPLPVLVHLGEVFQDSLLGNVPQRADAVPALPLVRKYLLARDYIGTGGKGTVRAKDVLDPSLNDDLVFPEILLEARNHRVEPREEEEEVIVLVGLLPRLEAGNGLGAIIEVKSQSVQLHDEDSGSRREQDLHANRVRRRLGEALDQILDQRGIRGPQKCVGLPQHAEDALVVLHNVHEAEVPRFQVTEHALDVGQESLQIVLVDLAQIDLRRVLRELLDQKLAELGEARGQVVLHGVELVELAQE